MPTDTPCPDDEGLRRLVLGLPGGAGTPDLEAHFAGCPRCAARAAGIADADDELMAAVRSGAAGPSVPVPPVPAAVLDRLSRLRTAGEELRPGDWVGAYRVETVLGRGGMGVVYLARHTRLSRPVAVKVLPPGAGADRAGRFDREGEAVAAFRHANVVQVHEVGETDGRRFLVMELADGGTLADRLARAVLPPAEAAGLVETLARAVAHAHAKGIIHRDLKPSNVLLTADGTPKVSDFGLAKRVDDPGTAGRTETGAVLGTPGYMAPEQATGGPAVGPAADVYGLGAVLYECLTGRPPFKGATVLETLDQVRGRDPVPPGQLQPRVPRDLETICLKCLEKNPLRRYPSAAALAADLGRFGRGEPVAARPVGPVRRAWKWARRRPTAAALVGACVVSAVALAGVVGVYTARLRDAVTQADANAAEADRQQEQAAANYRAARDALRRILHRLEERNAAAVPGLRELRGDQLEDALAFYQGMRTGPDDPAPAVRLDAALAAVEAGSIQYELGRTAAARETFRQAAAALADLPAEFRTRPEARVGLVRCYNHLSALPEPGREGGSEDFLRQALAEAEELLRAAPTNPAYQTGVAAGEHNLGVYFQHRGEHDRAEAHYLRAIRMREELADGHPRPHEVQSQLAEDLLNLGLIYSQTARPGPAAAAFGRAETLLRPIAGTDDHYALSLAGVYVNWGNLLVSTGDPAAAAARLDRAVELADAVLKREPRFATARQRATEAHGARAVALDAAGRFAAAVADWDRVVELTTGPAGSPYQTQRAVALARAGLHTRAAAEAHALLASPLLPDDVRYNLACVLALCAEPARAGGGLGALVGVAAADGHAAAAVRQLRQLHAAGYFRPPAAAKLLTDDPDLAALRGRTDFRRLLAETSGSKTQ